MLLYKITQRKIKIILRHNTIIIRIMAIFQKQSKIKLMSLMIFKHSQGL